MRIEGGWRGSAVWRLVSLVLSLFGSSFERTCVRVRRIRGHSRSQADEDLRSGLSSGERVLLEQLSKSRFAVDVLILGWPPGS